MQSSTLINKGQIYKYIAKPWNESELRDRDQRRRTTTARPSSQAKNAADEQSGAGSCENSIPDGGQTAPTAEETARVFDLANAIQRLLQA